MFKFFVASTLFIAVFNANSFGQDTLPAITVKSQYGKAIISWQNSYGGKINNINIQRSADSIKRFVTIGTVLNPMNKENGYVDTKLPPGRIFYRVFIAFEGGSYVFSKSYQPVLDTVQSILTENYLEEKKELKPVVPGGFVPSKFVFTGKDNNVILNLPGAERRKFSIKFFDETDNPVFEISSIREPYLILEKVNFLRAGWYKYQLFENEVLLEKYKFFIPKDSRNGNSRNRER